MRSRRREAELGAVAPLPVLWLASGRGAAVWGGRRGARPPWLLAEAKAGGRAKGSRTEQLVGRGFSGSSLHFLFKDSAIYNVLLILKRKILCWRGDRWGQESFVLDGLDAYCGAGAGTLLCGEGLRKTCVAAGKVPVRG